MKTEKDVITKGQTLENDVITRGRGHGMMSSLSGKDGE